MFLKEPPVAGLSRRQFFTLVAGAAGAAGALALPKLALLGKRTSKFPAFYDNRTLRVWLNIDSIQDRNVLLSPSAYFHSLPIVLRPPLS